jgi:hypothetical protein
MENREVGLLDVSMGILFSIAMEVRHSQFATAWILRSYYQPCWYSDELEIVDTFQPHEHASELHDCYGLAFAIEIRVVFIGLGILAQETT